MAIQALQIPGSNINNAVDPSQWSQLANLGNVYRQAQEDAAKRSALAQLGQGVDADAATLLHSGVPSLAQIGLNMQQSALNRAREDARYAVTDKRADAELSIRQEAARRAQETYDKQDADEAAAAKLIAQFGRQPAAAPDPAFTQGATPLVASPPVVQPPTVPAAPDGQAVPLAPGQMPPGAPGEPAVPLAQPPIVPSPIAPSQVAVAPPSVVDRIAGNLTSGAPAATAGISRDQLAELYRNPITRPIATAFLQKQFSPDTWKYEKTDDGRIIGINERTQETKDLTPPTASGAPAPTKQEREVQGYYQAGKSLGLNDDQARVFAENKGKMPTRDDLPASQQRRVDALTDQVRSAQKVLTNVGQLRELSHTAWGFPGATTASAFGASYLPSWAGGKSAVDTQDLINAAHSNVANVAKGTFGARVTNLDVNLLKDLESSADQPDAVRQKIYDRAEKVFKQLSDEDTAEAEGIINHTRYKPGGQPQPAITQATPAAPTAKPTLGEFMKRAREANPGYSDSEIANEWKRRYGG